MPAGPRTALLLMDLQEAILQNYPDEGLLDRIRTALAAARRAGLPVVWVRVCFRPGYPEVSPRNMMFSSIRQTGRLREDDPKSAIHPSLEVQPQDVVVTKRRVGAFAGSDLDVVLRAAGIEALVLAGVATSGVVLSTVRLAADMDYRLTVLSDGCADADPEVHRVLTGKVFPRQATVQTIAAWVATL
ncbi:MAG TPA: isochorismatase family cysteine hydrolase [Frateuria sp.]|uniref:isochorismatase family cysteine hydrolase n=1 Tax=Frateuria sp. TaxID=2211372 RepID=UPI002D808DBE|nr:isochorismatase family cysteine hydrolase [Frateuria sp.]HET6804472.1 isochorismatase family cysteine hydrolase [Frateuria sp.]